MSDYREQPPHAAATLPASAAASASDISNSLATLERVRSIVPIALEKSSEAIMVTQANGTIIYVNPAFEQLTGYTSAEATGQRPADLVQSGRQGPEFYERLWKTIRAGEVFQSEVVNRRKDGSVYVQSMSITPVMAGTRARYFISMAHDITVRRRAEERLRLLEAAGRAIGEAGNLAEAFGSVLRLVCQITGWAYGDAWMPEDGRLRWYTCWFTNPELKEFCDLSEAMRFDKGVGVPGRIWKSEGPEWHEDLAQLGAEGFIRAEAAAKAGLKAAFGIPVISQGEVVAVLTFLGAQLREQDHELLQLVAVLGTELGTLVLRKRAEQALAETQERLAITLRSIGDGVITIDRAGQIELMNPQAEALTGWTAEEARGRPLHDIFYIINAYTRAPAECPAKRALETGSIVGLANHTVLVAKDGSERHIGDSASPIKNDDGETTGVILVFYDATDQQRLETELRRANKLESLGVLAGGIAHDFNNSLAGIMAHIGLAKLDVPEGSGTHRLLAEAESACVRATSLTQQLLTFARGGVPVRKPTNIERLVRDAANFAIAGSSSKVVHEFEPLLPSSEADTGQVSQVIHNLVINAIQAMPEGGTIRIRGERVAVGRGGIAGLNLPEGPYVRVSVLDEGVGVPADHLERIFDPYFTTKTTGSGLGLAAAYSVIRNHEGTITVESPPGGGALFSVYLPAIETRASEHATIRASRAATAHILFMDDDDGIRRVMGEVLKHLGHRVSLARDGREAIQLYEQRADEGDECDVVVLDLTVPGGMGGNEALQQIRARYPGVRAVASSGYTNDPVMADHGAYGFRAMLAKPYTPGELQSAIDEALAR